MSLWAGQSAALVHKVQPAADIVKEIVGEARAFMLGLGQLRLVGQPQGGCANVDRGPSYTESDQNLTGSLDRGLVKFGQIPWRCSASEVTAPTQVRAVLIDFPNIEIFPYARPRDFSHRPFRDEIQFDNQLRHRRKH
jgi:hypothetical protein